ncbi:uncharacterized protein A1O5_01993 [Cladophialophora psammophila CBS 110553]|uniref:Lipase B n=1 Tax=Cladophialophora psammophila CBS 110553 TaxID=1182543 RepID=W9X487_9EURO|nr:uncharacterized protein A1O5_01993 [Cladophialophora psammophila CBS 110553]EXJ75297.1 hypothetical protein A1O5_01993 [Cladophialophora psammophila CBS 110553]
MVFGFNSINVNSSQNKNPDPSVAIYPALHASDAPYSIQEQPLRSAIFVPADFNHGTDGKTPVILVPGTGSYGGEAFDHNFAKLLRASTFGDPVWLNIPGRMCDEAPKNAEHVAYAINYIAAVCGGKKVAVVAWSQGNLSTQWALKYWPSTRAQVSNFVCLSADFKGTVQAWGLTPLQGAVPGTPAVWNQTMNSNFIATLRSNGGDSAYVPTTSIYSATDEVVQPQFGSHASAYMKDERKVGVTNCELQVAAFMKPAGLAYSHEGVMYSSLAWALAEDAIKNGGPGSYERINMASVCMHRKAPGLSLLDATQTQALSGWCLKSILLFTPKPWRELALPLYVASEKINYVAEEVVIPAKPVVSVVETEIVEAEVEVVAN